MDRQLRMLLGAVVCLTLVVAPWLMLDQRAEPSTAEASQSGGNLWQYWTSPRRRVQLNFADPTFVAVGDPIVMIDAVGSRRQVGEVEALLDAGEVTPYRVGWVAACRARFYPQAPLGEAMRVTYHIAPNSFVWVVETLFTPQRNERVRARLQETIAAHRDEIADAFRPVIRNSMTGFWRIIEEEVPAVLERHRAELEALAARYRRDVLEAEFLPLVADELLPIIRVHAEPELRAVGRELWDRLSLWRFGWRMAYDSLPLVPEKKLAEREWSRFVEQEALPVLREHSDEFADVIAEIVRDASRDPDVQETLRKMLAKVAEDPQLRELVRQMARELLADNPRMQEFQRERLRSREVLDALALVSDRLEPTIRELADEVFGTEFVGLTPEFVRVLRSQILHKDQRWFVLQSTAGERFPEQLPVEHSQAPPLGDAPGAAP